MAAGLGLLRLSSADFWAMTPRELAAALGARLGQPARAPMRRGDFVRLMDRYPDRN
ncbi:MAG: phage tail assembly chaperone [Hyphomicrobiaceae bacterium]